MGASTRQIQIRTLPRLATVLIPPRVPWFRGEGVLISRVSDGCDRDRDRLPNSVPLSPDPKEALVDSRRRSDRFAINIDNRSLRNFDAAVVQLQLEASPAYTRASEDAYELLAECDRFDPVPRRVDHQQRLCDGSARDS